MKVATWNVNSIRLRVDPVLDWLAATGTEVLCVQETKVEDANFPLEPFTNAGYNVAFFGQKSYNGVAIISKFDISDVQRGFHDDDDEQPKRLIAANVNGVRIVNTYIPNGTELGTEKFAFKLDWLQRLRLMFDADRKVNEDVLLCGDFNVAMDENDVWSVPAWEGKLHFTLTERAAMHYVKQWGFTDVYRHLNGEKKEFSWWNYREGSWQKDQGLRIDHIWVSPSLADKCSACWIDRGPRSGEKPSDHTPVVAEFAI